MYNLSIKKSCRFTEKVTFFRYFYPPTARASRKLTKRQNTINDDDRKKYICFKVETKITAKIGPTIIFKNANWGFFNTGSKY